MILSIGRQRTWAKVNANNGITMKPPEQNGKWKCFCEKGVTGVTDSDSKTCLIPQKGKQCSTTLAPQICNLTLIIRPRSEKNLATYLVN